MMTALPGGGLVPINSAAAAAAAAMTHHQMTTAAASVAMPNGHIMSGGAPNFHAAVTTNGMLTPGLVNMVPSTVGLLAQAGYGAVSTASGLMDPSASLVTVQVKGQTSVSGGQDRASPSRSVSSASPATSAMGQTLDLGAEEEKYLKELQQERDLLASDLATNSFEEGGGSRKDGEEGGGGGYKQHALKLLEQGKPIKKHLVGAQTVPFRMSQSPALNEFLQNFVFVRSSLG